MLLIHYNIMIKIGGDKLFFSLYKLLQVSWNSHSSCLIPHSAAMAIVCDNISVLFLILWALTYLLILR